MMNLIAILKPFPLSLLGCFLNFFDEKSLFRLALIVRFSGDSFHGERARTSTTTHRSGYKAQQPSNAKNALKEERFSFPEFDCCGKRAKANREYIMR